ncbi:MAG TPA: FkbM family methyltransferase [Pyrinomonadaceae bacterium]|nr:FkbM family methyltransferase [Pyrinomonadaceae bacterium]
MLRSLTLKAAQLTPAFVKRMVHHNRMLDSLSRKAFQGAMAADGSVVAIESGPMAGIKLAVSEHISHAHVSGTYEVATQRAIDSVLKPEFVCYDLGASIGYLSLLMASRTKQVFSFEPAPHAQAEIRKHLAANNLSNVEIVPSPVSDCERTVEFSLTDNAYGSRITETATEWPSLKLTTVTLDDFVATHPFPDFLKMDVEGEEGRVFEGARSILKERKTIFCCELHSREAALHCESILHEYNYEIKTLEGEPFVVGEHITAGEVQVIASPVA